MCRETDTICVSVCPDECERLKRPMCVYSREGEDRVDRPMNLSYQWAEEGARKMSLEGGDVRISNFHGDFLANSAYRPE